MIETKIIMLEAHKIQSLLARGGAEVHVAYNIIAMSCFHNNIASCYVIVVHSLFMVSCEN